MAMFEPGGRLISPGAYVGGCGGYGRRGGPAGRGGQGQGQGQTVPARGEEREGGFVQIVMWLVA